MTFCSNTECASVSAAVKHSSTSLHVSQLAQGQDGSFRRFAVLEFATADMAEEAQRLSDGRLLAGGHIRVSFCAPGPPGRSMLAALIAAQTMVLGVGHQSPVQRPRPPDIYSAPPPLSSRQAVNRGKGLLPDPTAMQILTGLSNPATLKMLLNPLTQGNKQGGGRRAARCFRG